MRRPHRRAGIASLDAYRYFGPSMTTEASRMRVSRGPAVGGESRAPCAACHFWFPHSLFPCVGQCDNPASTHHGKSTFADKPSDECFVLRSLDGLEFMWCEDHRQTIYTDELPQHRGCSVFVASAGLPVEDEVEFTFAGD